MIDLNKQQEDSLNQALEAMYFGFKAMVAKPDAQLKSIGMSRVHHRILYFIGRHPSCSVRELLGKLQASKQYIHKPLKHLVAEGFVQSQADPNDGRIKRLSLSEKGMQLECALTGAQRAQFAKVFAEAGVDAEQGWRKVMAILRQQQ